MKTIGLVMVLGLIGCDIGEVSTSTGTGGYPPVPKGCLRYDGPNDCAAPSISYWCPGPIPLECDALTGVYHCCR
jgi:hypothetical protein